MRGLHPPLLDALPPAPAPVLTRFPGLAEWPHREPGHWPLPGGGDVQGRQLRAAAGDAAVLGAEVGHPELGQAGPALIGPAPRPPRRPEGLGGAWPSRRPRAEPSGPGCAHASSGWDLTWAAGGGRSCPRESEGSPACSGGPGPKRSADSRSGSKPRAFSTVFLSSRPDGLPLHAPPCTHPADLPVNADAAGWPRCRAHPPVPTPPGPRASRAERGD